MAHIRKEFSEKQKSEIFARDRATCAFSCLSLWFLDTGIKSNWQVDWVDHILPSAAGGSNDLDNGICASNLFNSKKRNNTADNIYFVKHGQITENYIRYFGAPTDLLIEQLERLKKLEPSDWYFNRCISSIFVGFDWRCDKEFKSITLKRDDNYWFKSALKRLRKYQKRTNQIGLIDRGLLKEDIPFGSMELLKGEIVDTDDNFYSWVESLYSMYRESYKALFLYFGEDNKAKKEIIIEQLKKIKELNPEVLKSLKLHLEIK